MSKTTFQTYQVVIQNVSVSCESSSEGGAVWLVLVVLVQMWGFCVWCITSTC